MTHLPRTLLLPVPRIALIRDTWHRRPKWTHQADTQVMECLLEGCSPFSSFRGHCIDLRRPWVFPPQQMHAWLPVGHKPGSRTMGLRAAPRMCPKYAEPVVGALSCWGWETIRLRYCPPSLTPACTCLDIPSSLGPHRSFYSSALSFLPSSRTSGGSEEHI